MQKIPLLVLSLIVMGIFVVAIPSTVNGFSSFDTIIQKTHSSAASINGRPCFDGTDFNVIYRLANNNLVYGSSSTGDNGTWNLRTIATNVGDFITGCGSVGIYVAFDNSTQNGITIMNMSLGNSPRTLGSIGKNIASTTYNIVKPVALSNKFLVVEATQSFINQNTQGFVYDTGGNFGYTGAHWTIGFGCDTRGVLVSNWLVSDFYTNQGQNCGSLDIMSINNGAVVDLLTISTNLGWRHQIGGQPASAQSASISGIYQEDGGYQNPNGTFSFNVLAQWQSSCQFCTTQHQVYLTYDTVQNTLGGTILISDNLAPSILPQIVSINGAIIESTWLNATTIWQWTPTNNTSPSNAGAIWFNSRNSVYPYSSSESWAAQIFQGNLADHVLFYTSTTAGNTDNRVEWAFTTLSPPGPNPFITTTTTTQVVIIVQNGTPNQQVSYTFSQNIIDNIIGEPLCAASQKVLPIQCTQGIITLFDIIGIILIALLIVGAIFAAAHGNPKTGRSSNRRK